MTASQAGAYLSRLLTENALCRARWTPYVHRAGGPLSQAAVARALAMHLWDYGERPDSDTDLPRRLRDLVGRALSGQVLTPATLEWFVDAFDISFADQHRLTNLLVAARETPKAPGASSIGVAPRLLSSHRTLSLHEHHYLGPDGAPEHHETLQVIEAMANGLDRLRYVFDTSNVVVEAILGGRVDGPVYPWGDDLFAVDIRLVRPLRRKQTTTLRYETTFNYSTPPAPELRRGASGRINNLDLRVQFHPDRLPRSVSFSNWPLLVSEPSQVWEVPLETDHSVHRYLTSVEQSVVGFTWTWP